MISKSGSHGRCTRMPKMLGCAQLVMRKAQIVRAPNQIHAGRERGKPLCRMATFAGERCQSLTHRLDRDTARPHSLRSARFRIPSTEPAVQVGCNGLSTVLRLSFGLRPTVIRIQTSHSNSDMDCCHPSPQSSHELAFTGTMMALTSRTSIKRSCPSPDGRTFRLSQVFRHTHCITLGSFL